MANSFKTIVNIPGWVETFGNGAEGLRGGASAYARVPLVYRCTRLIADSLSSVELKVYRGKGKDKQEVEWPFEFEPVEWTWNTVSSILLMGASYSLPLKGLMNRALGLQWLDPTTVQPDIDRETGRVFFRQAGAAGGQRDKWTDEEMIYIRELRFGNAALPGPSAASVAMDDAGLTNYMTKFASYYFEHGAMPLTIIPLPTNTQDSEVKRVEKMWKSMTSGIKRAWSIMGLRVGKDGGQPYTLSSPLKELMMPQLDAKVRKAIADAFGIPITMLDDAANYATASEHNSQFWKTCVRPHGVKICARLNKYLGKAYNGLYAEYAFEELDEFQEDEANRADSVVKLTTAGMPLLVALDVLGYDMTTEQRKAIEEETERRMQVQERIASAEAGGGVAPNGNNQPSGETVVPSEDDGAQGQNPPSPPSQRGAEVRSALFNWKRAALKAVKTGHALRELDFDNPAIPLEAAKKIRAGLLTCKSAEDVYAVFKKAGEWCESPLTPLHEGGQKSPSHRSNTTGAGPTYPRGGEGELLEELRRANDLLEMEMVKGYGG